MTALQILAGIGITAALAHQILGPILVQRKLRRLRQQPTDDLKAYVAQTKNRVFHAAAINELKKRGEDISFAIPTLLDMALSSNTVERILGCSTIKTHFPKMTEGFEFKSIRLTKEERAHLEGIRQKIQRLT